MEKRTEGFVIAVTGLVFEARIAQRSVGVIARTGGGDAERLQRQLRDDARNGCIGIISFGIAGALDPLLDAGDLVVASEVVESGHRWPTDSGWTNRIATRLEDVRCATVLGSDTPIAAASDKRRLFRETGAVIVDMESHIAARVAAEHGLAFAVLRAVADTAASELPPAALAGMRSDGATDIKAVFGALAKQPRQIGALMRLGVATKAARASLFRSLGRVGPGLGHLDLG